MKYKNNSSYVNNLFTIYLFSKSKLSFMENILGLIGTQNKLIPLNPFKGSNFTTHKAYIESMKIAFYPYK